MVHKHNDYSAPHSTKLIIGSVNYQLISPIGPPRVFANISNWPT